MTPLTFFFYCLAFAGGIVACGLALLLVWFLVTFMKGVLNSQ